MSTIEQRGTTASKNHIDSREDYYETLNVPFGASKSLIRESYIRLKSAFSASNNAFYSLISDSEAQGMLAKIEEAFRVLNDEIRRREYDRSIGFETDDSQSSDLAFTMQQSRTPAHSNESTSEYSAETLTARGSVSTLTRPGAVAQRPGPTVRKNSEGIALQMVELVASTECGDGAIFKRLRELAGVTDEEMQSRTKICIQYIRAIEANDYKGLPQPVFVKGFLRSYLRYLSVPDPDRMVKAFADKHDAWVNRIDK